MTTPGEDPTSALNQRQPNISSTERKRFCAPSEDGTSLQIPSLSRADELLAENRQRFNVAMRIGEHSLQELRAAAQQELLAKAAEHSRSYGGQLPDFKSAKGVVLSGHQPELFHPGVWYKNFALSWLAADQNCAAVNLVIDSEQYSSATIDVPAGSVKSPSLRPIAFDSIPAGLPYEVSEMRDLDAFRSFGDRVCRQMTELGISNPLCAELWPIVKELIPQSSNAGFLIAAARHRLEQTIGLRTLELPLSKICQTESFALFAEYLLTRLPSFVEIHNRSLTDYRAENRLRGKAHPVPDLKVDGSLLEAPLWIWSKDSPQRQPLVVEWTPATIRITGPSLNREIRHNEIAATIMELARDGFAIRSRALLTTMYARMVLCDAFNHGIGGAKYDEVTDAIIGRFFGLEPPDFFTLTATLHLPLQAPSVTADDIRQVDRKLRDLRFHPEQQFAEQDLTPEIRQLIDEKQNLVAQDLPRGRRRPRHDRIQGINEMLFRKLSSLDESLRSQRDVLNDEWKRKQLLESREYSFCLFPKEHVVNGLNALLPASKAIG